MQKKSRKKTQQEIDDEVVRHADDDAAWEAPELVEPVCRDYKPDHNGECLNCDEPADMHPKED